MGHQRKHLHTQKVVPNLGSTRFRKESYRTYWPFATPLANILPKIGCVREIYQLRMLLLQWLKKKIKKKRFLLPSISSFRVGKEGTSKAETLFLPFWVGIISYRLLIQPSGNHHDLFNFPFPSNSPQFTQTLFASIPDLAAKSKSILLNFLCFPASLGLDLYVSVNPGWIWTLSSKLSPAAFGDKRNQLTQTFWNICEKEHDHI